jgi:hypothetical protein
MYGTLVIISVGNTRLYLAQNCQDHTALWGTEGPLYIVGCLRWNVGRNKCVHVRVCVYVCVCKVSRLNLLIN